MPKRLKILISAYACSPVRGSEPGVGWGFVTALAKMHDLWVIIEEEKFADEIRQELANNPKEYRSIHFFFLHKKRNRALRKIWPPSYYWYYRKWHMDALELAHELHAKIGFDLTHQLTMVGFREPGYLWQLDIPFVWGPIGGMGYFPWRFLSAIGLKGALFYTGYNCMNFLHSHFLPRPKQGARKAGKALITATPENQQAALRLWDCPSTVISEVGLPCSIVSEIPHRTSPKPLSIIWTGLHTPRKALNLALQGLAGLTVEINWELHILGKGEKTACWKNIAHTQGIKDRCIFHDWLPRQEALEIMRKGHLLLITSLRDLTSTVTIEALALGLPIVCLDHCGFAHVVTADCGVKIPVQSPGQVITDIASAITKIYNNEPWRQQLATGALKRAQDFTWEKKARQVNKLYLEAIRET